MECAEVFSFFSKKKAIIPLGGDDSPEMVAGAVVLILLKHGAISGRRALHAQQETTVEVPDLEPAARGAHKLPQVVARAVVVVLLDIRAVCRRHAVDPHELAAVLVAQLEYGPCPDFKLGQPPAVAVAWVVGRDHPQLRGDDGRKGNLGLAIGGSSGGPAALLVGHREPGVAGPILEVVAGRPPNAAAVVVKV